MIKPCLPVTLNATTYTAVALPPGQRCSGFTCWLVGGGTFLISHTLAGTTPVTTLANQVLNFPVSHGKGETLLYAKASTGTPVLAVTLY